VKFVDGINVGLGFPTLSQELLSLRRSLRSCHDRGLPRCTGRSMERKMLVRRGRRIVMNR
jgi:hypothetical protein